jgi:hypothetical protein
MAKISYLLIPEGYDLAYKKALSSGDRFVASRVRRNNVYRTRRRIKGLTAKSLLPQVKLAWDSLTTEEQEAWALAGSECNLNGYRLFVKDKTLRIKNDLAGNSTPQVIAQAMVGVLLTGEQNDHLKITQVHPSEYWVSRKVTGTKNQFMPVKVQEDFDLPLQLGISYASSLVATGPNPYARYYAVIYSNYQGRTLEKICSIDFDLDNPGDIAVASLSTIVGKVRGYTLFIELHDCQGALLFDNVYCIHSGQNWVRDPFCNDIDQSFTRAFYQVPKHWSPIDLPEGAFFGSEFLELLL